MRKGRHLLALTSSLLLAGSIAAFADGCSSARRDSEFDGQDAGGDGGPFGGANFSDGGDPFEILNSGCATSNESTTKAPAYLEFVLDGSGSMNGAKWSAATGALGQVFDALLQQADTSVGVGIVVFEDSLDPGTTYPSPVDVHPAFVNQSQHDALMQRISGNSSGGTPLGQVLVGVYAFMENMAILPPLEKDGRKVVVVVSDGEPSGTPDKAGILKLAGDELALAAPKGPIKTFAVGVGPLSTGSGYDPKFMADLSIAGGTRSRPNCNPNETQDDTKTCHFQITPGNLSPQQLQAAFLKALNRIRAIAQGCEFLLDVSGGIDPGKINVKYTDGNGQVRYIKKDAVDGWTYDDDNNPTKVILNGASCSEVENDLDGQVEVIVGCETVKK